MTWDCNVYNGEASKEAGKEWMEGSVDLVYLDPPFFSQKDYGEFDDRWKSMDDYLYDLRLVLRSCDYAMTYNASIYLHCDTTASHRIRCLMDDVFGADNFRNEIVWKYNQKWTAAKRTYSKDHDVILYYARGDYTYNPQQRPPARDKRNGSGYEFQSNRGKKKKRYLIVYGEPTEKARAKIKEGDYDKVVYYDRTNTFHGDVWTGIGLNSNAKERNGYPTQKPLALLDRIIKVSSNEGDMVLDPMCGSGTTLVAAKQLGRRYTGFDLNDNAIAITQRRLDEVLV